jgi:hypothetical protein
VNRGRRVAAGALLTGIVLLTACTTIRGLVDTEDALKRAGFTEVDVGFSSAEGFDQVEVTVGPASSEGGPDAQADQAATVVWTTFPLRFDLLRVELLAPYQGAVTTYTYGEMEEIFGPRPPGLDDKELGDDVVRTGVIVAAVLVGGGLLFVAAATLAIVLGVRASRRRKSVTPPPWPPVVRDPPGVDR